MSDFYNKPRGHASPLPIELMSAILQLVPTNDRQHDVRSSIGCCSMVSRLWRSVALPYLFRLIEVRNDKPKLNLQAFITLLDHSPYLMPCVQTLRVNGYSRWVSWARIDHNDLALLDPVLLASVLSKLPRLKVLVVIQSRMEDIPDRTLSLPSFTTSLTRLTLRGLHCLGARAFSGVAAILNSFSSVEALEVSFLSSETTRGPPVELFPGLEGRVLGVKNLVAHVLKEDSMNAHVELLQLFGVFRTFNSLSIRPGFEYELQQAAQLVPRFDNSLQSIVLDISTMWRNLVWVTRGTPDDSSPAFREALNPIRIRLSQCSALHSLKIVLCVYQRSTDPAIVCLEWLTSLPSSVRHLVIDVSPLNSQVDLLSSFPWLELTHVCTELKSLRSVTFHLSGPCLLPVDESAVRSHLKRLDERGILYYGREPTCATLCSENP